MEYLVIDRMYLGESYNDRHEVVVRDDFSSLLDLAMNDMASNITERETVPSRNITANRLAAMRRGKH